MGKYEAYTVIVRQAEMGHHRDEIVTAGPQPV
jgi:hypothetical protein